MAGAAGAFASLAAGCANAPPVIHAAPPAHSVAATLATARGPRCRVAAVLPIDPADASDDAVLLLLLPLLLMLAISPYARNVVGHRTCE
jgi:hypothetical protein